MGIFHFKNNVNLMGLRDKLIKSKSDFFKQDYTVLMKKKKQMEIVLGFKDFSELEIGFFEDAYDYFVVNPSEYDGATASQDLYDLPGIEFPPVSHDFDYVAKNCMSSLKYTRISDKILFYNMKKMGASKYEICRRKTLLWLKSYVALYHLHGHDKMSKDDMSYMDLKKKIILK